LRQPKNFDGARIGRAELTLDVDDNDPRGQGLTEKLPQVPFVP
jgi:hypothetical protein